MEDLVSPSAKIHDHPEAQVYVAQEDDGSCGLY